MNVRSYLPLEPLLRVSRFLSETSREEKTKNHCRIPELRSVFPAKILSDKSNR